MKSKRGYRDQKGVYGVTNWLKYYFQRFTSRNTGGGCKHIHQQAQDEICDEPSCGTCAIQRRPPCNECRDFSMYRKLSSVR
jgi:hypothetical protein